MHIYNKIHVLYWATRHKSRRAPRHRSDTVMGYGVIVRSLRITDPTKLEQINEHTLPQHRL